MEGEIVLCGDRIRYQFVDETEDARAVPIPEYAASTRFGIESAITLWIVGRVWWLWPELRAAEPPPKFVLSTGKIRLPIFVLGDALTVDETAMLVDALAHFCRQVADPRLWQRFDEIVVLARGQKGPCSRLFGIEAVEGGRVVYIEREALTSEAYLREIPCTRSRGAVAHELAHVVLEDRLRALWEGSDLGWMDLPGSLRLVLPDGRVTDRANVRPYDCPTKLASLTEADDRAESAVSYLAGLGDNLGRRADLVECALGKKRGSDSADLCEVERSLPKMPKRVTAVRRKSRVPLAGFVRPPGTMLMRHEAYASYMSVMV